MSATLHARQLQTDAACAMPGFDEDAFRREVRAFCERDFPADLAAKAARHQYFSKPERVRWQKLLNQRGWFVGHWPREFGGQGWGPLQHFILNEELERAGTPWLAHFGISFVGPVIYTFGDEDQKRRYLGPIRDSNTWWCQGFSEPGAGSDLASLSTRAVRDGDHYVVSGQKTWTTMAQWADMMFCLVRTHQTERPQQGISFLLIDLASPGVTVKPIATIDGCHHVNEVFLDEVRVPAENLVGREGDGWKLTKFIVGRERLLVAEVGKADRLLDELKSAARKTFDGGQAIAANAGFRRRLADLEVKTETLRASAYAAARRAEEGTESGIDASILKIRGSELQQAILDATIDVLGSNGLAYEPEALNAQTGLFLHGLDTATGLVFEHLHGRATTIYGGSNEIQRGIIAKSGLGL